MEILNLFANEVNQNGYHFNKLTKNKIGILCIAPVNIVPDDCLACDGYVLKIVDYKKLYSAIGTKFNAGSESSDEFRIPDYNITGRFLQPGTNVGNQIAAGLPNITAFRRIDAWCGAPSGAFYTDGGVKKAGAGTDSGSSTSHLRFDASRSNSIYGKSNTVQPPSQIVHLCIRYK